MVPLLKFWFQEDVRRAAVQSLPELVRAATRCVEKGNLHGVDTSVVKQVGQPPLGWGLLFSVVRACMHACSDPGITICSGPNWAVL